MYYMLCFTTDVKASGMNISAGSPVPQQIPCFHSSLKSKIYKTRFLQITDFSSYSSQGLIKINKIFSLDLLLMNENE